jgi:hypothetical protein
MRSHPTTGSAKWCGGGFSLAALKINFFLRPKIQKFTPQTRRKIVQLGFIVQFDNFSYEHLFIMSNRLTCRTLVVHVM